MSYDILSELPVEYQFSFNAEFDFTHYIDIVASVLLIAFGTGAMVYFQQLSVVAWTVMAFCVLVIVTGASIEIQLKSIREYEGGDER